MGIVVLYLAADFVRQMAVSHQRKEEYAQIEQRIALGREETVKLTEELEKVGSPQAIEEAVRPQGMIREDEVLVIPVGAPSEALPEDEPESLIETEFDSPREAWLDLFFGTR
jgi:hypothetical protein